MHDLPVRGLLMADGDGRSEGGPTAGRRWETWVIEAPMGMKDRRAASCSCSLVHGSNRRKQPSWVIPSIDSKGSSPTQVEPPIRCREARSGKRAAKRLWSRRKLSGSEQAVRRKRHSSQARRR